MVFRPVICLVLLLFLSIPFEVKAQGQEIISGYQVIANDAGITQISLVSFESVQRKARQLGNGQRGANCIATF